jgi:hypothetical protein
MVCVSNKTFSCVPCNYFCTSKSNLSKHLTTKKNTDVVQNPEEVIGGRFKCQNCVKNNKGNTGLWAHKKKCKAPELLIMSIQIYTQK